MLSEINWQACCIQLHLCKLFTMPEIYLTTGLISFIIHQSIFSQSNLHDSKDKGNGRTSTLRPFSFWYGDQKALKLLCDLLSQPHVQHTCRMRALVGGTSCLLIRRPGQYWTWSFIDSLGDICFGYVWHRHISHLQTISHDWLAGK